MLLMVKFGLVMRNITSNKPFNKKPPLFALFLLLILIIPLGCQKLSEKTLAEQKIEQVLEKWYDAFKAEDYEIQWDLLSLNSPMRTRFTHRFSFPEEMSEEEKNKSAFLTISEEVFGPFKRHELFSIDVKDDRAKACLVLRWAGHLNEEGKYIRPMRKRVTLELVKEKGEWRVFDRKDGFVEFPLKAEASQIKKLLTTENIGGGNIIDLKLSPDKSSLVFETDRGVLGCLDINTKKTYLFPLFDSHQSSKPPELENEIQLLGWSPLSNFFVVAYRLPDEDFKPFLSVYDKQANVIIKKVTPDLVEQAIFDPRETCIVFATGEQDSKTSIVKLDLRTGAETLLWDDEQRQATRLELDRIFGFHHHKLAVLMKTSTLPPQKESAAESLNPQYLIATIHLETGLLEDYSQKWAIVPGTTVLAYSLGINRLVLFNAQLARDETTDKIYWNDPRLRVTDFKTGVTMKFQFMSDLPAEYDKETGRPKNIIKFFSLSPAQNRILFSFFIEGGEVLMLASLKFQDFQSMAPRFWDQENTRNPQASEPLIDVLHLDWSPGRDIALFVVAPGKVFIASKDYAWKPAEIKNLAGKIEGPAYWQTDERIIYNGWNKSGEKEKSPSEAAPKGIYAIDVSLQ